MWVRSLLIAVVSLFIVGALAALGAAGYLGYEEFNIVPGKIVTTTFTGCPAYLGAALLGPRGELASQVSTQDALDFLYVDVPGSAGAYSSWFRPSPGANALYDPSTQASQSAFPWSDYTCSTDDDCLVKPHMACGQEDPVWGLKDPKTGKQNTYKDAKLAAAWSDTIAGAQCGSAGSNDPTNAENWLTCSFSDATQNHGLCMVSAGTLAAAGGNPYSCTSAGKCVGKAGLSSGQVQACSGNTCPATDPSGSFTLACNVDAGYCQPDNGETMMIMAPWRAEGVVTDVNADGTVNVQWYRLQLLWSSPGPQLSWFPSGSKWNYTDGVFIADESDFGTTLGSVTGPKTVAACAVLGASYIASQSAAVANTIDAKVGIRGSVTSAQFAYYQAPWGLPTHPAYDASNAWGTSWGTSALIAAGAQQGANNSVVSAWNSPGIYTPTTGQPGWMGALALGQTGGLPCLTEAGGNTSQSAWNLKSTFKRTELRSIPAYTIQHTNPLGNSGLTPTLLSSMSTYRTLYMADRPPHLQIASS
jgi:hypothetical protein